MLSCNCEAGTGLQRHAQPVKGSQVPISTALGWPLGATLRPGARVPSSADTDLPLLSVCPALADFSYAFSDFLPFMTAASLIAQLVKNLHAT